MYSYQVDEIARSDPRFWSENRKLYLEICLQFINENPNIDAARLLVVQNEISNSNKIHHNKSKADTHLHDVLNRLNETGISDAVLPTLPIKILRKIVLAKNEKAFVQCGYASLLLKFFWDDWLTTNISSSRDLNQLFPFAIAFSASAEAAFGKPVIYSLIASLTPEDLMHDFSFRTRIHPKDETEKYSILNLPSPTQLLMACFLEQKAGWEKQEHLFFPERKKNRRGYVLDQLKIAYKDFIGSFKCKYPDSVVPQTWESFGNVAPLLSVLNREIGLEPFIYTVQSGYPLPVSHPKGSQCILTIDEKNRSSKVSASLNQINHCELNLPSIALKDLAIAKNDDIDWSGRSKLVIKNLCRQVSNTVKEHQNINSYGIRKKFSQMILQAKNKADQITPNQKSALHLALNWIQFKVINDGITGTTVCKYLNRVFYNGILNDPDSIHFNEWESEDHELLFEDIISRDSIKSEKTRQSIASPYLQAYQYGLDHDYFSGVNLSYVQNEWAGGTPRFELIGLEQFDLFIKKVMSQDDDSHSMHMLAVVFILAFYGCMRSGEISRLTLKDLEIMSPFLWINILKGKSAAARRKVPCHILAPKYALQIVSDYYTYRRKQFRDDALLKDIALFGPYKKRDRFTRTALAGEAIKTLQSYFGNSFVLHSLRHCGCSWLLIRLYGARYSDLIPSLNDHAHPVFSEEYIEKITFLFSGELKKTIPNYCGSSLIRLSKLMGHLGQRTTFTTYIHSFHVIQAHAMKRISNVFGQRKLNGDTINALMSKMKSKSTRAKKHKDKSINAVLEYVLKIGDFNKGP